MLGRAWHAATMGYNLNYGKLRFEMMFGPSRRLRVMLAKQLGGCFVRVAKDAVRLQGKNNEGRT